MKSRKLFHLMKFLQSDLKTLDSYHLNLVNFFYQHFTVIFFYSIPLIQSSPIDIYESLLITDKS